MKRKPIYKPPLHPIIQELLVLKHEKGFSGEELVRLINGGVLAHDPICIASFYQWTSNGTVPRGDRLLAIQAFIKTHRNGKGRPKR
jgi:hypothetical protein